MGRNAAELRHTPIGKPRRESAVVGADTLDDVELGEGVIGVFDILHLLTPQLAIGFEGVAPEQYLAAERPLVLGAEPVVDGAVGAVVETALGLETALHDIAEGIDAGSRAEDDDMLGKGWGAHLVVVVGDVAHVGLIVAGIRAHEYLEAGDVDAVAAHVVEDVDSGRDRLLAVAESHHDIVDRSSHLVEQTVEVGRRDVAVVERVEVAAALAVESGSRGEETALELIHAGIDDMAMIPRPHDLAVGVVAAGLVVIDRREAGDKGAKLVEIAHGILTALAKAYDQRGERRGDGAHIVGGVELDKAYGMIVGRALELVDAGMRRVDYLHVEVAGRIGVFDHAAGTVVTGVAVDGDLVALGLGKAAYVAVGTDVGGGAEVALLVVAEHEEVELATGLADEACHLAQRQFAGKHLCAVIALGSGELATAQTGKGSGGKAVELLEMVELAVLERQEVEESVEPGGSTGLVAVVGSLDKDQTVGAGLEGAAYVGGEQIGGLVDTPEDEQALAHGTATTCGPELHTRHEVIAEVLDDKEHADGCRHEVGEREERHEEQIGVELLVHGTDVAVHYKHAERVDNAHRRLSQQTQEGVDSETGGIVADDKHADGIDTEAENPRKEEKQGEMAFYKAPEAAPSPVLHAVEDGCHHKGYKDNAHSHQCRERHEAAHIGIACGAIAIGRTTRTHHCAKRQKG